jgi:hypothetical protein
MDKLDEEKNQVTINTTITDKNNTKIDQKNSTSNNTDVPTDKTPTQE